MSSERSSWPSSPYRNYVIAGLAGVVIVTVVSAVITDSRGDYLSRFPIFMGGGAVTIFLLGILGYWWYQILSGYRAEKRQLRDTVLDRVPPLSALRSWQTLYQEMVLYGGKREFLERELATGNRKIVEWFLWANLITLFPIVNVWLYLFGIVSQGQFMQYIVPAIVILIVLMLGRTYMLLGGGKGDYQTQMQGSLGLAADKSRSANESVLLGERRGRSVRLEIKGKHSVIFLDFPIAEFKIESPKGKFEGAEKLPVELISALELPRAKRWQQVRIEGSQQGIKIERTSRGQNMWLYDLWLAERLAEAAEGQAAA